MAYVRSMEISRRSFIAGTLSSLTLIFGGFGWREEERLSAIEAKERYGQLTVEQLEYARELLDKSDVFGSCTIWVSEEQHEDLVREHGKLKSAAVLPGYEVIKWQRLT